MRLENEVLNKISDQDIQNAIDNDDAEFFTKNKIENWANFIVQNDTVQRTCLQLAVDACSENVSRVLLANSQLSHSDLNDEFVLPRALWKYCAARKQNNQEKTPKLFNIVKMLIDKGASPFVEMKTNIFHHISSMEDLELFKLILTCPIKEINLEKIAGFLASVENTDFRAKLILALKEKDNSFRISDLHSSLLNHAIVVSTGLAQLLLQQEDIDVNYCGFGAETPLAVVERQIQETQEQKKFLDTQPTMVNIAAPGRLHNFVDQTSKIEQQKLENAQYHARLVELQQSLTDRGAKSLQNPFADLPRSLKPYVDPANFFDDGYDIGRLEIAIKSNQQYQSDVKVKPSLAQDLQEYFDKKLKVSNNNNSNFVSLELDDVPTDVTITKQAAPTGWFSWLPSCCGGSGYKQVKDENIEVTQSSNLSMTKD